MILTHARTKMSKVTESGTLHTLAAYDFVLVATFTFTLTPPLRFITDVLRCSFGDSLFIIRMKYRDLL